LNAQLLLRDQGLSCCHHEEGFSPTRDLLLARAGWMQRLYCLVPLQRQVFAGRIGLLNQRYPLPPIPALNLFFTRNGIYDIAESLAIDQAVDSISSRKPFNSSVFMFSNPTLDIVRDACIYVTGRACEDVYPEVPFSSHDEKQIPRRAEALLVMTIPKGSLVASR
jgi:hypothetical protein